MSNKANTKANKEKDSTIPRAAKHFPMIAGCFAEAWIPEAAHIPWYIEEKRRAKPTDKPIPMPFNGGKVPFLMLLLMSSIKTNP
jgi:hypothetical protein